ncbi:MAG: AraC family transcriptional regulator [Chitinophagaceae bacterium]|nr:AraC family transcriptional regulator [Chitinophagaceae bacterium]
MVKIKHLKSIAEHDKIFGIETLHPLISIVDYAKTKISEEDSNVDAICFDFYSIYLKDGRSCKVNYGRKAYDFQEGSLVFISPGKVIEMIGEEPGEKGPSGYGLFFHSDLLKNTSLGKIIYEYSFFNYELSESVHLSKKERKIVFDCFKKIKHELAQPIDKFSKKLIVSHLELFLNYCARFYERQFETRDYIHRGIVEKFETYLNEYFENESNSNKGIPTVSDCAKEFNLSANYFSDLVKMETGKSAQHIIHNKIIEKAKVKIFDYNKSISQIAYELGFKYPNHFVRFFKQKVGQSPNGYRSLN